jgi:hypothetical protein
MHWASGSLTQFRASGAGSMHTRKYQHRRLSILSYLFLKSLNRNYQNHGKLVRLSVPNNLVGWPTAVAFGFTRYT